MFRGFMGWAGEQVIESMPTFANFMQRFAPAYFAQLAPVMNQFLADNHRLLEAHLTHVEDRNTRAPVAAMLLSGAQFGPIAGR